MGGRFVLNSINHCSMAIMCCKLADSTLLKNSY